MRVYKNNSQCKPTVSVVCISFNHAHCIQSALNGFMSQSTTFDFEIILHDDASTDETPAILKGFQEKYPDKVTLVQQTENQYSKGEHEVLWYAMSFATGDFIAVCEGDDYWIDPYKLQKQYDVLVDNPGINGCFHPTFAEDPEGNRHIFANHASAITTFTAEESILGDGAFCPTASLFFRRDVTRYMSDDLMKMIPCGDYFIQLFSAFSGGLVYLPEPMSVYRTGQVNSFSGSFAKVDWKSKANFYKRLSDSLSIVDEITKAEFSEPLNEMKRRHHRTFKKHMRKHMKSKVKAFFKKKHSTSK